MGCCHGREEDAIRINERTEKSHKKHKLKPKAPENAPSPLNTQHSEFQPEITERSNITLIDYLDLCKEQQKYGLLVQLISETTEIADPSAYIP